MSHVQVWQWSQLQTFELLIILMMMMKMMMTCTICKAACLVYKALDAFKEESEDTFLSQLFSPNNLSMLFLLSALE